jgi:hypothetical protein
VDEHETSGGGFFRTDVAHPQGRVMDGRGRSGAEEKPGRPCSTDRGREKLNGEAGSTMELSLAWQRIQKMHAKRFGK